jgi:competence protein ComEA
MYIFSRSQQLLFATIVFFIIIGRTFFTTSPSPPHFLAANPARPHGQWVVEVIGSVPRPGIYLFNRAPTLGEAIRKAGANPKGQVIVERGNPHALQSATAVHVLSEQPTSTRVTVAPMEPGTAFIVGLPIDVNRAEASELSLVPGISDRLAGRIVGFRQTHGPFETWQDLEHVKGLGATTIARIKDHLQIE